MKFLYALVFAALLPAAPSFAQCDPFSVEAGARRLASTSQDFATDAGYDQGYQYLARDAQSLAADANVLGNEARYLDCWSLRLRLERDVAPLFQRIDGGHRQAQAYDPNPYVAEAWRQVGGAYAELSYALQSSGGGNPPGGYACNGLDGQYGGTCRVANSPQTSQISFLVTEQNGQCIVSQSPYFQPAVLGVRGGRADADVREIPGGVAIRNTHLTVYGRGSFVLTGYNYAGRFNFTCSP